jgi:hypothetical protein
LAHDIDNGVCVCIPCHAARHTDSPGVRDLILSRAHGGQCKSCGQPRQRRSAYCKPCALERQRQSRRNWHMKHQRRKQVVHA